MVNKIEVSCSLCDADFMVSHDLERPYRLMYCPFCGEPLHEDSIEVDEVFGVDIDEEEDAYFYD